MSRRRRYTDEERATALAALAANGGNVNRTAAQLGIPVMTLRQWNLGTRHPEATQMSLKKKPPLARLFEKLAYKMLGVAAKGADKLNGRDATISAATAVDKMRLLDGESTENTNLTGSLSLEAKQKAIVRYATYFGLTEEPITGIGQAEAGIAPGDGAGEQVHPPGTDREAG